MRIEFTDFNNADAAIERTYAEEWQELADVLEHLPLHLKASDQAGIQGRPIFDPVGTNAFIKNELGNHDWSSNLPIPQAFSFLGTDVDFLKRGLLVEAQFSNYPFLLNNVVRGELFYKAKLAFTGAPVDVLVVVTKGRMFPASNSTLYYEQAVSQLRELSRHKVFDVPLRAVGLQAPIGQAIEARWTKYHTARYSRTVVSQKACRCLVERGRSEQGRCRVKIIR